MTPTTKELMACFVNPTKSSILLSIQQQGTCTPKELMALQPEIPQATLYRTLKQLTKIGLITVVAEKQIRAVVEKTYALNDAVAVDFEKMIADNNGTAYFQLMASFTLQLMAEFKAYAERPTLDILNDGSGFSATPIYTSQEELQTLAQGIAKLIQPYQTKSTDASVEQSLHTLALIFTPPQEPPLN